MAKTGPRASTCGVVERDPLLAESHHEGGALGVFTCGQCGGVHLHVARGGDYTALVLSAAEARRAKKLLGDCADEVDPPPH